MRLDDRRSPTSHGERLARFVHVCAWIALALSVAWLGVRVASGNLPFTSHIDPRTGTAGLLVETDAGTGCDYIVTPWGGIVPRTGPDGKQLCGPRP